MAEVIRTVVTRAELVPVRPEPDPVVMRGVTLVPRHGTPVIVKQLASHVGGIARRDYDRAVLSVTKARS